ncbi:hypothetical protein [Pedobacter polysacchareus]|uniref:hypothetical protein n=1 Tax=Pedobacter polysacchareus TaxID=2861973 RepID=UPI001C9A0E81|nr:hypothetical protein [Pedobacter polysacchareus]
MAVFRDFKTIKGIEKKGKNGGGETGICSLSVLLLFCHCFADVLLFFYWLKRKAIEKQVCRKGKNEVHPI